MGISTSQAVLGISDSRSPELLKTAYNCCDLRNQDPLWHRQDIGIGPVAISVQRINYNEEFDWNIYAY